MSVSCRGLLLTNAFLRTDKFCELYSMLKAAAEGQNILLEELRNDRLLKEEGIDKCAENYDFCLFWDKDIKLGKRLEGRGLRLYNSSRAVEICDDKAETYLALEKSGILMPKTLILPFTYSGTGYGELSFIEQIEEELGYPMVVKAAKGSFGMQVYLAEDHESLAGLLKSCAGDTMIAQEYIKESRGRDVRIHMVGDRVSACMERRNDRDFRANITGGGSMYDHRAGDEEIALCRRVMEILQLDFAGIDILFSDRGPMLCEVNSNAHFKNIYDHTGINVAEDIMSYIRDMQ